MNRGARAAAVFLVLSSVSCSGPAPEPSGPLRRRKPVHRRANHRDDPMDSLNKVLMTLASYNAGPRRVRQLRREAARRGLDPNVWFGNVERIASERIGRETVQYVGNIYKYYVAYKLTMEQAQERQRLKTRTARTGEAAGR